MKLEVFCTWVSTLKMLPKAHTLPVHLHPNSNYKSISEFQHQLESVRHWQRIRGMNC